MNTLEKVRERYIKKDATILEALKLMDFTSTKLLIVFDQEAFIGVLSIGDIQKAIIENRSMETKIHTIMRKDYIVAKSTDDKRTILNLMQEHRIECMPVVNEDNRLVSAYLWSDLFDSDIHIEPVQLNLPVVIMAGGEGNRLKPLTNVLPKPLIPLGEKTMIELIMDQFSNYGCNKFFISVNYKAEMIKYYLSTLTDKNYNITFFQENMPLGTVGSLHLLKGKIDSTFFISNCDIIIDQDVSEIYRYHKETENEITIVAALKTYSIPYGIMETSKDGRLLSISEKPDITLKINTGLYLLEPHLINEIPENQLFHITTLIENLQKQERKVGVFPVSEKSWKDIGEWSEYKKYL